MCKEDVRLGRATASQRVQVVSSLGAGAKIAPADPDRIAVSAAIITAPVPATPTNVIICWLSGDGLLPLIGLSDDHPCDTATIGEQGMGMTQELYALAVGPTPPTVIVNLSRLTKDLEKI